MSRDGLQPTIQIAQAGYIGYVVLTELRAWLQEHGVHSDLKFRKSKKPRHQDSWRLRIRGRKWSVPFLRSILPFVIVKRTACQDVLRFLTIFPSLLGAHKKFVSHCPAGHPYDAGNTVIVNGGKGRACRTCRDARVRKFYLDKKHAA
jgi:hypothetical protein